MHTLLLLAFLQAAPTGEPLRTGCYADTDQIGAVVPGDRVQVLSAMAGEAEICYRITVSRPGQNLTGYVLGDALPEVREFQRQRQKASQAATALQARQARAQAAAARRAGRKKWDKSGGPLLAMQFEDFSGRDARGKPITLSGLKGRVTIVSFWSPRSGQGPHQVMSLMPLYNQFHRDGLAAVGISMDPDPAHIVRALDDVTPNWPQMADRDGLAAHYKVDARLGKVFVLDSSRRIVAAGPMGPEIEKAVRQLLRSP
jgi:peroxiredoxin